ncbi:MAG: RAD55 family ATPase [Candidatus Hodarchaeota archaeon]
MPPRLSTGIIGLDNLLEGGLLPHSVTGVIGSPGTGKTTVALNFILEGLESGDHALYLTFEESPKKLLSEAALMGLEGLESYYDEGSLIFHHATGEEVVSFLTETLPHSIDDLKKAMKVHSRVVVDPLTPVLWELEERKRQRAILTRSFDLLREFGTILITLEEPTAEAGSRTQETAIPLYLVDNIINLQFLGLGGQYGRTLRIYKSRGTRHGELVYPLMFMRGAGVVVFGETEIGKENAEIPDYTPIFDEYARKIAQLPDSHSKATLLSRIALLKQDWISSASPESVLQELYTKFRKLMEIY